MSSLCIIGVVLALRSISLSAPPGEDRVDLSQLRARVSQLQERVTELAGDDDLLDTLHFGWLDRPYARATLAILVKTTSMLEREVYLRELGNGAIDDATVRNMLLWSRSARPQLHQSWRRSPIAVFALIDFAEHARTCWRFEQSRHSTLLLIARR